MGLRTVGMAVPNVTGNVWLYVGTGGGRAKKVNGWRMLLQDTSLGLLPTLEHTGLETSSDTVVQPDSIRGNQHGRGGGMPIFKSELEEHVQWSIRKMTRSRGHSDVSGDA